MGTEPKPECCGERVRENVRTLLDLSRVRRRWKQIRRVDPGAFWLDYLAPVANGEPLPSPPERGYETAA